MESDPLLERFVEWASGRADVRAALLIGSRARSEKPADEFSDTDVVVVAADPDALVEDAAWPAQLGDVGITFVEETPLPGIRERRVLFADGRDVDFAVMPVAAVAELAAAGDEVLGRGFRVLLDKDGLLDGLTQGPPPQAKPPSAHAFAEVVSDFWYHAVWTARKLARGEVFTAKSCCDGYMKWILVRMLEWHAGNRDTWHDGRFVEEWADARTVAELRHAYATYEAADVQRALGATMGLFGWVARETAERLGYAYPAEEEELALRLTLETLRRSASSR